MPPELDDDVRTVPCRGIRVAPPAWRRSLWRASLALSSLPALIGGLAAMAGFWAAAIWMIPFVLLLAWRWIQQRHRDLGPGSVSLLDHAIFVEGRARSRRIALRDIRSGARSGSSVRFELARGAQADLDFEDESAAERVIKATGTSVEQRTLTFELRETLGPFVRGLLLYMLLIWPVSALASWLIGAVTSAAIGLGVGAVLVGPLATLALAWWLTRAAAARVTIGQDGIVLRRWWTTRFVPHASIGGFSARSSGIDVDLGKEQLHLSTIGWSDVDVERAMERLRSARAAFDVAREAGPIADTTFVRRGQSVGEWRKRMLDADFRRRSVTAADAEAVLGDPTQPLEHRAGAAIALRALEPGQGTARVRVAAEVAAEPEARQLLLATLEDDPEVDAALDELDRRTENDG